MTTHYFSPSPDSPLHRKTIEADVWGHQWSMTTANGVFAGDGVDRGTAALLRESKPPVGTPRVLDLGCGYGTIALAVALACPGAVVDAVDVNERALLLCGENAAAVGVADRVRALLPDQVEPGRVYDEIWTNPPIRVGKDALHELLLTWLPRLAAGGTARIVISKNLGGDTLLRWLNDQGFPTTRVATDKGFRVLLAHPRP
ncbi:MAG TPA: methyltransferase [Propionibacteriaceae bacterium]